ncbi:MAG: caspase family protein [Thermodesulfobacteriota bacterium]
MKTFIYICLIILVSGCVIPVPSQSIQPKRLDPLAGIDVGPSPYSELTVGVIMSENTKSSTRFGQEGRRWVNFDLEKIIERFDDAFRHNFKTVVKLEKMDDANAVHVDLIAVFDRYTEVSRNIKFDASVIFFTPDRSEIDTVKVEGISHSFSGLPAKSIETAAFDTARRLEAAIRSSAKLREFAKSASPHKAAVYASKKGPVIIDIHHIPDFQSSPRPDDLAVIIGIENYKSLPMSDHSKSDAAVIKDYLKAFGFQERNIEFAVDADATKSAIEKAIEAWLPNRVKKDSKVFVYYSGHGAPEPNTSDAYIVPHDGDPNYLEVTGYPLKRLYDRLGKLQVAEVIVLLDSCFSGAGGRSVLAQGARPLVMITDIKTIPSNMAILSATQGSQISTSSPEKGHGIFTYYFLKAIKDGKKNIAEIYEYIKPLVEDEAKQINVQQSPGISPDIEKLKGRFILRK